MSVYRNRPKETSTRGKVFLLAVFIALLLSVVTGCTSMLPMTDKVVDTMPEEKIAYVMERTKLSREQVLDPTIHRVDENKMGCWEMVKLCFPGLPWYMKVLGSVPLACTTIYQWPDATKSAVINYCWWTPESTMAHERKHGEGHGHKYW